MKEDRHLICKKLYELVQVIEAGEFIEGIEYDDKNDTVRIIHFGTETTILGTDNVETGADLIRRVMRFIGKPSKNRTTNIAVPDDLVEESTPMYTPLDQFMPEVIRVSPLIPNNGATPKHKQRRKK